GATLLATLLVATTIALLAATAALTATVATAFAATTLTAPVTLPRVAIAVAAAGRRRGRTGAEQAEQAGEETGLRSGSGNRCRCCLLLDLARLARRRRLRRLHVAHRRQCRDVEVGLGQRMRGQLARRAALVAGARGLLAELVLAQPGDFVVRRLELVVGHDHDRRTVARLDFLQRAALLVEQEVGDLHRGLDQHLSGVLLHRMLL